MRFNKARNASGNNKMESMRKSFFYISLVVDMVVLIVSFSIADFISRGRLPVNLKSGIAPFSLPEVFTVLVFLFAWYFSAKATLLYDELKNHHFVSELFTLLKNVFIQMITGVIILFSLKSILLSRFFLMSYLISLLSVMVLFRVVFRLIKNIPGISNRSVKKVLIVGSGETGRDFFCFPDKAVMVGFQPIGYISDIDTKVSGIEYLGKISTLTEKLEEMDVDEVLISLGDKETKHLENIINILSGFPVRARIIPEYSKFISNKYQITFFNNIPVIDIRNDPLDELHLRILKRVFDVVFSLLFLLLIFSWFGLIISLIIKITSPGPVFFSQERWGRKNKKFTLYKFRSMVKGSKDLDNKGKFVQATKDDVRITRFGRFLRRTSLDELPQFFNVLKGDMSVVGPRPHAVPMNLESKDKIKNYMLRHLVKPGITGWAQVNGLRGETGDSKLLSKRISYDMFYIENWSFWFDMRIIFLTVWRGIKGDPNAY